jgi:hypothetical protein
MHKLLTTDIVLHRRYFSLEIIGLFDVAIGEKTQITEADKTSNNIYPGIGIGSRGRSFIARKKKTKLNRKHVIFVFMCNPPEKILTGIKIAAHERNNHASPQKR